MCTVTYIPRQGSFLLASNRDENRERRPALPPAIHSVHGQRLLFPRDGQAGGTWIAAGDRGQVAVLLNGAFEKHQPEPPYRLSRGLMLLELLTAPHPREAFNAENLQGIEPFTIILADQGTLFTGRWTGGEAFTEHPDPALPHLWSSVTLYPEAVREKRRRWFSRWLGEHPFPDVKALSAFHEFTGDGDPENDLKMERENGIFTNSISVLDCHPEELDFHYLDLRDGRRYRQSLSFLTSSSAHG